MRYFEEWLIVISAVIIPSILFVWVQDEVVWPAAMALLAGGYALLTVKRRWLSLSGFVIVTHIVSYPVAALLNVPFEDRQIRPDLWNDAPLAMWGCALGLLFLGIGIQISEAMAGRRGGDLTRRRARLVPTSIKFNLILASLAFAVALIKMRLGLYFHSSINDDYNYGASTYLNALEYATVVGYCGIYLQWYRWTVTREKKDGIFAAVTALIPFLLYLPSGSRLQALGFIPMLLIAYFTWETRLKKKVFMGILGISVVAFTSVAVQAYRDREDLGAITIERQYQRLVETSLDLNAAQDADERTFIGRLADFLAAGRIIAWTPEVFDYRYFEGVENWWQIALPRVLRPESSELNFSEGALVTLRYGVSAGDWSSTPITIIGDLFSRFGWPGIVFGMLAIGAALRQIDHVVLDRDNGELWRFVFLFAAGKTVFFMYSMSALIVVVTLTRDLLICYVVARLVSALSEMGAGRKPGRQAAAKG